MLSHPSDLLEQINSVIQKNSCKESPKIFDYLVTRESIKNIAELNNKGYFSHIKNIESLKKLEQRIENLEEQNNHLLYFIHFLVENFPDLVKSILSPDQQEGDPGHCRKNTEPAKVIKKDNPCLTRREMDVLHLLVKGLCAKEIAKTLFISETTVITHKKNLKEKFNARNTAELVSKAFPVLAKEG